MNLSSIQQMLNEKRKWWEATAEHMAEQATLDEQSRFTYNLAILKLAAIGRTEKRIVRGVFGRCDRCGAIIDDGRLEIILDNEYHYCAACAAKSTVAYSTQRPVPIPNGHRVGLQPAPQMT